MPSDWRKKILSKAEIGICAQQNARKHTKWRASVAHAQIVSIN